MRANEVLQAINGEQSRFCLPRDLITTDRVLQRWAVGSGTGLPTDEWDDQPKAKPPPLPDDVAIEVDQCVAKAPSRTNALIWEWYKTQHASTTIAEKLRMSRRNLYRAHGVCLEFMKWRFEGTGNQELIRLIKRVDILDPVGT